MTQERDRFLWLQDVGLPEPHPELGILFQGSWDKSILHKYTRTHCNWPENLTLEYQERKTRCSRTGIQHKKSPVAPRRKCHLRSTYHALCGGWRTATGSCSCSLGGRKKDSERKPRAAGGRSLLMGRWSQSKEQWQRKRKPVVHIWMPAAFAKEINVESKSAVCLCSEHLEGELTKSSFRSRLESAQPTTPCPVGPDTWPTENQSACIIRHVNYHAQLHTHKHLETTDN